MRGFYSPIDQLAAQLPRTKGTGAEFMTELSKRPGYKPQEAQDRDLQTLMALPKMERAQFLQALKSKPAPELEESTLAESILKNRGLNVLPDEPTKYHEYTLPGGSNYREILLQMPHDPNRKADPSSGHWDQPNVLAHVRAKDRTGPNGEKILHIEEIQSDWHQQGRDKGYLSPDMPKQLQAAKLAHQRLKEQLEQAKASSEHAERGLNSNKPLYQDPEVRQRLETAKVEHNNSIMDLMPQVMKAEAEHRGLEEQAKYGVPDAPFKKNWHELALKKMIHHAAEKGYDAIAITPGAEQADRYQLAKHIDRVELHPNEFPNRNTRPYYFIAYDKNQRRVADDTVTPEQLEGHIGKELTNRILSMEPNKQGKRYLDNANLEVGGEGMKGFYDKMVPSFLNQFGKKYGAQVGTIPVAPNITEGEIYDKYFGEVHDAMRSGDLGAQRFIAKKMAEINKPVPMHHFPITPQMREDVTKNGVPLYAEGGSVPHLAIGGQGPKNWIKGSVEQVIKPLLTTEIVGNRVYPHGPELDEATRQRIAELQQSASQPGYVGGAPKVIAHLEKKLKAPDVHKAAINQWIDRNLTNYIKKQMATHDDPIRKLAEQGIVHMPPEQMGLNRYKANTHRATHGAERLGESDEAKAWEDATDVAMEPMYIRNLHPDYREPWMEKADPKTQIFTATNDMHAHYLGFDHLVDILKQDVAEGRIRPEQLSKVSIEHAVRRAHEYDQEMAKKMAETQAKVTEGMPVHKEYPEGYKWVELALPETPTGLPEGWKLAPNNATEKIGIIRAVSPDGVRVLGKDMPDLVKNLYRRHPDTPGNPRQQLEQALKYEGDTMGHCVGGYCPDVLEGRSRIYSLRDAKGEPHVTIEVKPTQRSSGDVNAPRDAAEYQKWIHKETPPRINQIKGKQNRAPKKDYIPYVQDFVKSGKWSEVGDARNAGLRKYGDVFNVNEQRQIEKTGEQVPEHEWLTGEDIQRLHNAIVPPGKRLKYDANGNIIGNESGYAKGGSIKPIGYTKEKVTVSPNLDAMRYELMSVKHFAKKVK